MEKNLTSGSVFKKILVFSLPYLLSYLLQTLYGMADLYIIGQFEGVASTTAVSIGSQVMHMLTVMIVGLAMGATVFIGQAIGAGDRQTAASGIGNTATLFMGVSVALTALLVLLVRPITAVMSTPADAVSGTVGYLTVCFIGIPFITAYNVISAVFRGMGDSKSPMYFIAVACAANIGLDYLFMGVFHLGPIGAALGTTLSQAISVAVSLIVILKRKTGIPMSVSSFRPRRPVMKEILGIGVPVAFQDGLIQIAFIVITVIANRRGLDDSAAVGIVEKVMSFLFLVPSSMLSTVSALGAQNIGANKPERAVATLRHYEDVGLVAPEYIDPNSGYRYYSTRQFEVLNTIRYLRVLDMPLCEIADFLGNRDVERIKEKLQAQKATVMAREAELRRIERKIDNRLRAIADAENSEFDRVRLVQKGPCRLVWVSDSLKICGFLDMEKPIRKLEQTGAEAVIFLGKVGVGISVEHLRERHFDSYDGIFLILDEEDRYDGATEEIPETLCVSVRFHGSHGESAEQYRKLMEYMEAHQLEVCGFSREITMIDYGITNDTEKFVTEISIPVACG